MVYNELTSSGWVDDGFATYPLTKSVFSFSF